MKNDSLEYYHKRYLDLDNLPDKESFLKNNTLEICIYRMLQLENILELDKNLNNFFLDLTAKDKFRLIKIIELIHIPNKDLGVYKIKFLKKFIKQKKTNLESRYIKPSTKLNLIDCLIFDLNLVLNFIESTIKLRDYKNYIIASNRGFIDWINLKDCLRNLDRENQYVISNLKEIITKCFEIFDFCNTIIDEIRNETDKRENWYNIDFGEDGFLSGKYQYYSLIINELQISYPNLSYDIGRNYFRENNLFKRYQISHFAQKSEIVLNIISDFLGFNDLENLKLFAQNQPQQTETETSTLNIAENNQNNNDFKTKVKNYKDTIWFTTGIKLATGEAFDLYRKYKNDKGQFTKICLELGFKESDRTYFSSTISDNKKNITDKNTFANKDKLQKLHKHLTENNLSFGTEFLVKFNEIELEYTTYSNGTQIVRYDNLVPNV